MLYFLVPHLYEIIHSGSCSSHNMTMLETKDDCTFAGKTLDILWMNEAELDVCPVGDCQSKDYTTHSKPYGCAYKSRNERAYQRVYWVEPTDNGYAPAMCGSISSKDDEYYSCICSIKGRE